MLVKVLGLVDIVSAFAFLLLVFDFDVYTRFLLFCAGLLFFKGLFILTGDVLSAIDIFSSAMLILSIFFMPPVFLLWIPAFLLLAKGFVSLI